MNATDPKQGEREYYARLGREAIDHSLNKPFSDDQCSFNLANLTAIFQLLPPPPARIVELGCGVGWIGHLLARRGYDVLGVDIAPEAIVAANARSTASDLTNARFVVADYEEFNGDAGFDAALFYDSLHHAEDPELAMSCAYRALKTNGILLTFEPGEGHHDSSRARELIEEFGVHENDMPAQRIAELGRRVGFRRRLYLPQPWEATRQIYRPGYFRAASPADLIGRYLLGLSRMIRHLVLPRRNQRFVALWK